MSLVSKDPNASRNERMADLAKDPLIVLNYLADPLYSPYCMRCEGVHRMQLVEPFRWEHERCGSVHDERPMQWAEDFLKFDAAIDAAIAKDADGERS